MRAWQARPVICYLGKSCHRHRHRMFPVITLFAMLRKIETLDFMMLRHTQTDDYIDEFQNRQRSHDRQRSGNSNSDGLIHELMCVPFQRAGGKHASAGIFEDWIYRAAGEDACEQRAQSSACAVNAESVERVVIAKARFYMRDHQVAEDAGDSANAKSSHRRDKTCCGRNGDQSRDCTGDRAQSAGLAVTKPLGSYPSNDGSGRGESASPQKRWWPDCPR